MKPPPFDYSVADGLEHALELLAANADEGKIIAGGQSLVPMLNFRLARPSVLIDVNGVQELSGISRSGGELRIGALTRHAAVERSPLIAGHWPLLRAAVRWVAHPQIRNRGTIGGSCCHSDPSAEMPVALTALDARFIARSAARGERELRSAEMFAGQLENGLEDDELLIAIRVPAVAPILDLPQYLGIAAQENALRFVCAPGVAVRLRDLPAPEGPVSLLVGPEGGLEEGELLAARAAGFRAIALGPRVLRTETAGLGAVAAMMALWGDW